MSDWQMALVREQGQNFAVVVVADHVIQSVSEREQVSAFWAQELGCRVALFGARQHRTWGPRDIVTWLSGIDPRRLPWRQMNVAA